MKAPEAIGEWVLLCYQLPREPSTRRVAVWRKLRRLGVAQLADGLVTLPADARTREQLDWIADEAVQAGGTSSVWLGRPASPVEERRLAASMADARAQEYRAVTDQATAALQLPDDDDRARVLTRLREQHRQITRRDFFPPPERDTTQAALAALAAGCGQKAGPSTGVTAPPTGARGRGRA